LEPDQAGLPGVRSCVRVTTCRTHKRTCSSTSEHREFVCSREMAFLPPPAAIAAVRGHWGGVEIRNHWRKDHVLREDATRSRNPNIAGALALLRNVTLTIALRRFPDEPLPSVIERLAERKTQAMCLLHRRRL
jgi:hypothetical protein